MTYSNAMLADVLDRAVEILEANPWGQGCGRLAERQICGQDAIWGAAIQQYGLKTAGPYVGAPKPDELRAEALYVHLNKMCTPKEYKVFGTAFWRWNDTPGRTKQDVIDRLKEVSKDLRNTAVPK